MVASHRRSRRTGVAYDRTDKRQGRVRPTTNVISVCRAAGRGQGSEARLDDIQRPRRFTAAATVLRAVKPTSLAKGGLEQHRLQDSDGIKPEIGEVMPMSDAERAFRAMAGGETHGKTVFTR